MKISAVEAQPEPKVEEVPLAAAAAARAELDALLEKAGQLPKKNLDDFWKNLAEKQAPAETNEHVLTWEEARKLGLTHD